MTSQVVKTDRQPTGLYVLFLTEMWERFSYYAMRGILVLYLIKVLQFSESHASKWYGLVTSLIYVSPLIGGYIADKFWGIVKGKCREKVVCKFNLKGDIVEVAGYNDDGSLGEKYLIKYDSQGNMIEEIKYEGEIMKPVSKTEQVIVYRK